MSTTREVDKLSMAMGHCDAICRSGKRCRRRARDIAEDGHTELCKHHLDAAKRTRPAPARGTLSGK